MQQDAQARDETGSFEPVDDPLDPNDLDDDDDDDEITASDLGDDVIPADADADEQEDPMDTNKDNGLTDAAQMIHSCENCGKENFVLAPKGFRYTKTAAKSAALRQRMKAIGEALAPVFVFKTLYREARRPKQAPFAS